jgi:hypothetical protein
MKRSGGQSGRPFGHVSIEQLERHVRACSEDVSEMMAVLSELGHRETKRAENLKSLVQRLLGEKARPAQKPHEPLLE